MKIIKIKIIMIIVGCILCFIGGALTNGLIYPLIIAQIGTILVTLALLN